MKLHELAGAYVVALAIEGLAIEAECPDAYFDACGDDVRIARDRMLKEAWEIVLACALATGSVRDSTTDLFREGIERSGDAREKAIEVAFRIAVETGQREEVTWGIRDPMVAIIGRILDKQAIRRKHEGRASEL